MDLTNLKSLCDSANVAVELISCVPVSIYPYTVRTKGQLSMQRLFYVREGSTKFVQNNNRVLHCKKGDIVYLPPDVTYESHWEVKNPSAAILIRFDLYTNGDRLVLFDDIFVIAQDPYEEYLSLILELHATFEKGLVGHRLKCQSIFLNLLYSLSHHMLKQESIRKNDTVYRAVFYIENHFLEKLDVNALAKMCSLCPSAFRAHFRKVTGLSPIRHKNLLMMKKAADLLRTGDLSVSEVARMLGIDDIYYFNRMFRQFYDIPPGKYRALLGE